MASRTLLLPWVICLLVFLPSAPSAASAVGDSSGARAAVTIDGKRLSQPVRLDPKRPVMVEITLENRTAAPMLVRSVRLGGSVLGLTFFDVGTSTRLEVPANQMRLWRVEVDVADLWGQATGLLPLEVAVIGQDRRLLASVGGTADVRGSLASTYGLFAAGILVVTAMLWASALLALARQRLPANRWMRALRFAPGGVGLGLALVTALSVLRVTPPEAAVEIGFVLAGSSAAFLVGYLTPPPRLPAADELPTFAAAAAAGAATSIPHQQRPTKSADA